MFDRTSDILSRYLVSDYTGFFVTVHGSRFVAIASKKAARRTARVIDLSADQREGGNFVAKMQWETKSRQAGETWHDDSLLEAPTTILKFPPIYPTTLLPCSSTSIPLALAREHPTTLFLFFHLLWRSPRFGLGGARLRLKTYDAVIFIAFRRLYAHLNFNARASRAARVNIAFFARTRMKTCVRCHPLPQVGRRRQNDVSHAEASWHVSAMSESTMS